MPAALVMHRARYRLPPPGAPLRVAFVGHAPTVAPHVLHLPTHAVRPVLVDSRAGSLRDGLARAAPHVVVALTPEDVPPEEIAGVRAVTLAVTSSDGDRPSAGLFDRVLVAPGPDSAGGWRSRPLPIDDRLFATVRPSQRPPRALFLGRATEHREWVLARAKHGHDVLHYAHGLTGIALDEVLAAAAIGIALNRDARPGFPPQALLHLAAGHLLLAETLSPTCGLEPGIDFLQFASADELLTLLYQLERRPNAYDRVRLRGRLKAEEHRASRVWPRILADLLRDVRVFGSERE